MIRLAVPADAPGVQAIYAPVVRETTISFELEPPTVEAIEKRIVKTRERWP
jgi:phosphinothricin acetyltransferase